VSGGNLALLEELAAEDIVDHSAAVMGWLPGRAGFKQHVIWFRTALPDLHITVDDMVAEGNRVVAFWTARGTHEGEFFGVAPTGKPVTGTAISVLRVAGGQIAEYKVWPDRLAVMQQVGAIPAPAQVTR
jgi:steroid delta-isomerase-like uncharacterized protein